METAVFKVESNNINKVRYLNVMNSWIDKFNYKLNRESSLYAISFGGRVQAGAAVDLDEDILKVTFLNNSVNHLEEINRDGTIQLSNLLEEEYGSKDKVIKYVITK